MNILRPLIMFFYAPMLILLADANTTQVVRDQNSEDQRLVIKEELERAFANEVSEKESIIVKLNDMANSRFTQEQLDQKIAEAIANKNRVIDELNETVLWLPGAENSIWDIIMWDQDDWFIDVHTLRTPEELEQAIADLEAAKEIIIAEKNEIIAELDDTVAQLLSQREPRTAGINSHPDEDGDGLTDTQELTRGTDPSSYKMELTKGWNLVSVSRVPDDNSTRNILGNHVSNTVWTWEGNRFRIAAELLPLHGYWIYVNDTIDIDILSPNAN